MRVHVSIMAITSRILIILCMLIILQCTTAESTQPILIYNQNLRRLYENSPNRLHITSNSTIYFALNVQTSLQSNIVFRDVENLSLWFVFSNLYCTDRNGFVFINITGLEIVGMTLTNCGMKISQSLIQEALTVQTNSNYQLLEGVKAAVFAVNVHNLRIELSSINGSQGYGFLGINVLGNSIFHHVDIIGSNALAALDAQCTQLDISFSKRAECQGGNALFLFDDLPYCPFSLSSYTLTLNRTYISDGVNPLVLHDSNLGAGLSAAGGLSVSEGQSNYALKLNLISSLFIRNRGSRGGNILIQLPSNVSSSSVTIRDCLSYDAIANFPVYITVGSLDLTDAAVRSSSECRIINEGINDGGKRLEVLNIENSNFTFNVGGGISIFVIRSYLPLYLTGVQPVFIISIINCTIRDNLALGPITGAASGLAVAEVAYGERQSTEINIVGTIFKKNLHVEPTIGNNTVHTYVATNRIQSIGKATFRDCTFSGNNYSAVLADNSFVFFEGTNSFINNTSPYGGAFFLSSSARILLKPNAQLIFINNFASERGGAIFVDVSELSSISRCNVEVFDPDYLQLSELNITMEFINNSAAVTGDVYYGGILDQCNVQSPSVFIGTTFKGNFTFYFVADFSGQNSSRSLISADGTKVCLCDDRYDQKTCPRQDNVVSYYPGERFEIFVVVRDHNNNPVPSVVTTRHIVAGKYDFSELTETSRCNPLTYRLQYIWKFELLHIIPSNLLLFEELSGLVVTVDFLNCSNLTGFILDNDTKVCTCVPQLQERNMTCNIDTKIITRQPPYWLGNYSNTLLLHDNCPYDFCKPDQVQIFMTEPNISEQCASNRYGILCGSCREGFSLVLGSSRCLKCSNSYLSLLIPFGLAGVALISLLFIFNLTTYSGKINGFIFYANIVHINGQVFFSPGEQNVFKIFFSWINLDLGIETCFYNGMGSHAKLWLQFVFPLYLIILLILVAIIHHLLLRVCKDHNESEKFFFRIAGKLGRRIIPVLATIFLLSFTKLLQVIFTVLSFTRLDYPDGNRVVWLYDGNIAFGSRSHLPLFILSLILLFILILPYIVLLVLFSLSINTTHFKSNKIVRYFNRPNPLKNFVDAYLNPYKNKQLISTHSNKTYPHCGVCWPALLLVTRAFHVIVFASTLGDPGVNLFVVIAETFLLIVLNLAVGGVYRCCLLTVLETAYLLNIGTLAAATAVSDLLGVNHTTVVYLSIVIAIITFASAYIYRGLIVCINKYRHNSWCSNESATIPDLEHDLPPNSGSREQPKPCVTTTTIEGIPKEKEEEEEEEIDTVEQQAETAL